MVFKDARLGINVGFEGAMSVQMIGSDVQHHSDFGMEGLDGFKLKAGNFEYGNGVRRCCFYQRNSGRSDVAPDYRAETTSGDDFSGQRRCGRLAIGPSDRNDGSGEELGSQFDLANDGFA